MSDLSFGKLIVPSLLTTGAVFTALSAPVVMFADTPLNIRQGNRVVYDGTVRNAALPYLALAGTASVSLGVAVVASAGWRKASKRADDLSETLDDQTQRRAERESHLMAALASESYLKKSGLDFFLEDGELTPFVPEAMPLAQPLFADTLMADVPPSKSEGAVARESTRSTAVARSLPTDSLNSLSVATRPVALEAPRPEAPRAEAPEAPRTESLADQLAWLEGDELSAAPSAQPEVNYSEVEHSVVKMAVIEPLVASPAPAPLPSAQGFYGFVREAASPKTLLETVAAAPTMTVQDQQTIAQMNSLQNQLQAVVSQIDALRAQLPTSQLPASAQHQTIANAAMPQAVPMLSNLPTAGIEVVSQVPDAQSGLVNQSFEQGADDRRSGEDRRSEISPVNLRRLAS